MDENVIVTTFSEDSRAYGVVLGGAVGLPAGSIVEEVEAKLRKLRERLRHLMHR
jgi:hypothetical protein